MYKNRGPHDSQSFLGLNLLYPTALDISRASGLTNGVAESVLGVSSAPPISPAKRNQYNVGFEQTQEKYIQIDAN